MSKIDGTFRAPSNKAEFIQLLDEAIRLADDLNEQLDKMGDILAAQCEEHLAA